MVKLWCIEEVGIYTHEKGNSMASFLYESSAKIYLEKLKKISGNEKRNLVITPAYISAKDIPPWSWIWDTTEEEENKQARGE